MLSSDDLKQENVQQKNRGDRELPLWFLQRWLPLRLIRSLCIEIKL